MLPPISMWSRARRNATGRLGWPRPLWAAGALWGLSDLSAKEHLQVSSASEHVRMMVGRFKMWVRNNIATIVENPRGSWIWHFPV